MGVGRSKRARRAHTAAHAGERAADGKRQLELPVLPEKLPVLRPELPVLPQKLPGGCLFRIGLRDAPNGRKARSHGGLEASGAARAGNREATLFCLPWGSGIWAPDVA